MDGSGIDAPYWPAAWYLHIVHIDIHHLCLGSWLRFISLFGAWAARLPVQINGRDKVAVAVAVAVAGSAAGRCSPDSDPDMAARLRLQHRLQSQRQLQLRLRVEYGSFRANDIKKHIMESCCCCCCCFVPGMRSGQKAKGRSSAKNYFGILICIVKSSANPAHFAELSA